MRSMILTALMLVALALAVCSVTRYSPTTHAQGIQPAQCCGKKPQYSDPAYSSVFTGQVAVTTSFAGLGTGYVLEVIDLKNQSTAPINSNYAPPMYHGPAGAEWTKTLLGNVFGLTLDNQGNIYTTATTAYNSDFFPVGATGGEIYKIDTVTGAVTILATLPNPGNTGLGNINYDCQHQFLYVSNVDNGLIYKVSTSGAVSSLTWDHGANLPAALPPATSIPDIPTQAFTPAGRRIWAVQAYQGRLYYSVWANPGGSNDAEVWSVALAPNGDFLPPARREISVPHISAVTTGMPVSDISFGPTGTMLLGERSMASDTASTAHQSRALEYTLVGSVWTLLNPNKYLYHSTNVWLKNGSAGGVDYDFGSTGRVWLSGDAIHFGNPDYIYGIEGVPATGGDASNSILIDLDTNVGSVDKYGIGDVEISCPFVEEPACTAEFSATAACQGQPTTFTDSSSGATTWSWTFGDGGTSTLQNPTHLYTASGSYTVTLSVNGGACTVTHMVIVAFDCFPHGPFDDVKARLDNMSIELQRAPDATGYIVVYAGRRSPSARADYLGARARNYLIRQRRIDSNRLVVVNGGYRERDYMELWIVPRGVELPRLRLQQQQPGQTGTPSRRTRHGHN